MEKIKHPDLPFLIDSERIYHHQENGASEPSNITNYLLAKVFVRLCDLCELMGARQTRQETVRNINAK